MNWLLIIVLAVLLFSAIRGWRMGLLRLLYSLVSGILLIVLIAYAIPYVTDFLKKYVMAVQTMESYMLTGVAFLITLIIAIVIVRLIGRALKLVNKIPLIKGVNRVLGIFGGLLEAYLLISAVFFLIYLMADSQLGQQCLSYIKDSQLLKMLYDQNLFRQILF